VVIPPISPLPTLPAAGAPAAAGAASAGDSFSQVVGNAVDALQSAQTTASTDEAQAAAGQGNLADTMIAATEASLDTQVSDALIDKAVTSYNSIMSMTF
jgi:flagellar hook-basal body complex protein FliE